MQCLADTTHSRTQADAAASLAALTNQSGFVTSGHVQAFGSDLDMKVFRKHWFLEKVFHPIPHIHICSFIFILLSLAVR